MPVPAPRAAPGVRTEVTCSKCGAATTVPFTPTPGRPVYCRECFAGQPAGAGPARGPGGGAGGGGGGGGGGFRGGGGGGGFRGGGGGRFDARPQGTATPRQRMMAQGRKGHFMYDARDILNRLEGGMDEQHIRSFLESLFAKGARTNTAAAQDFLDEKLTEQAITPHQRDELGRLVERYSFWR